MKKKRLLTLEDLYNYYSSNSKSSHFSAKDNNDNIVVQVNGGNITKPIFIIDHRDKYTILKYIETIQNLISEAKKATGGVRANRWKAYYDFKKQYLIMTNIKKGNQILYRRDIDYAFAITAHRAQGSTYDNVFVDLNDMIYNSSGMMYDNYEETLRRLYVACSRARKELVLSIGR